MEINLVTSEDIIIADAPSNICLYSDGAKSIINQFIEIASRLQSDLKEPKPLPKAVVLVQNSDAHDFVSTWEEELRTTGTQQQTFENILDLRWLLYLIRHSKVPWYYLIGGDVLGSHWELALSCTYRYSFRVDARLGFPEISTGVFIAGGILESLVKHGEKAKEKWQMQNTLSALQCFREGIIQYCIQDSWEQQSFRGHSIKDPRVQNHIQSLLKNRIESRKQATTRQSSGLSSFVVSNAIELFIKKSSPSKLTRIDPKDKADLYRAFQFKVADYIHQSNKSNLTAWDYCWEIVKERATSQRPLENAAAVTRVASVAFFQPKYVNWLSRQKDMRSVYQKNAFIAAKEPVSESMICIDITDGYPPIEALVDLAENQLVLFHSKATLMEFKQSLEIIFSRLDRTIGHAAAAKLWSKQILWTQGQVKLAQYLNIRWIGFEKIQIHVQKDREKTLRNLGVDLGGIRKNSLVTADFRDIKISSRIISALSTGVISLSPPHGEIPWETIFRSLILEELIKLTRISGGDLSKVCENLRKFGWGFAADEELWHYYLKSPEDLTQFKTNITEIDNLIHKNSQFLWEIGSWKQARTLARKEAIDDLTNPVMQSRQLAFFVGYITSLVAQSVPKDDDKSINQLALECLGFPKRFQSPLDYLYSLGKRRESWSWKIHIERRTQ